MSLFIIIPFSLYSIIGAMDWFFSDPFDWVKSTACEYSTLGISSCMTKEEYCRYETKKMFVDLNDTWGSSINHENQISYNMIKVYEKCLETE